jgi:hypothetical protein
VSRAASKAPGVRIVGAKPGPRFEMLLAWSSGKELRVDLREIVFRLRGLAPLRDRATFARAEPGKGGHSLAWPGELDIGADRLWELSLEQNGRADAAEFIRWRWRHGLSLTDAARALGLSRRQVAYYVSGEHAVPRTVLLACKGWEAEQQAAA